MQSISVFLDKQNLLISGDKMLMSAELRVCVTWFIYFLDLLCVRYNCAKFHHCRICVTDFGDVGPHPPIREQPRKSPSWIRLRKKIVSSAYAVYRNVLSNILRPFIFLLSLVNKNTISKTSINKYAEIGSPCLVSFSSLN